MGEISCWRHYCNITILSLCRNGSVSSLINSDHFFQNGTLPGLWNSLLTFSLTFSEPDAGLCKPAERSGEVHGADWVESLLAGVLLLGSWILLLASTSDMTTSTEVSKSGHSLCTSSSSEASAGSTNPLIIDSKDKNNYDLAWYFIPAIVNYCSLSFSFIWSG